MTPATDMELVTRHLAGDERAFAVIVERYTHPLTMYLRRFFPRMEVDTRHDLVQDLLQETFWRVHAHAASLDTTKKFSTWVYTVAGNLARNQLRDRKRHDAVVDRWPQVEHEDGAFGDADFADPKPDHRPDIAFDWGAQQAWINDALTRIPAQMADTIHAKIAGKKYEDIAAQMGVNVGTVKSRIWRGRRAMSDLRAASGQ